MFYIILCGYTKSLALSFLLASTDFIFDPIVFDNSIASLPLSLRINDDVIPEPREVLTVVIGSVEFEEGRTGMPPNTSGSIEIEIFDNDCKITLPPPPFIIRPHPLECHTSLPHLLLVREHGVNQYIGGFLATPQSTVPKVIVRG